MTRGFLDTSRIERILISEMLPCERIGALELRNMVSCQQVLGDSKHVCSSSLPQPTPTFFILMLVLTCSMASLVVSESPFVPSFPLFPTSSVTSPGKGSAQWPNPLHLDCQGPASGLFLVYQHSCSLSHPLHCSNHHSSGTTLPLSFCSQ